MKRVEVNLTDLPTVPESYYLLRLRVVSLDENRTSHWVYIETPKPTK